MARSKRRRTITLDAGVADVLGDDDEALSSAVNEVLQDEVERRQRGAALARLLRILTAERGPVDPADVDDFRTLGAVGTLVLDSEAVSALARGGEPERTVRAALTAVSITAVSMPGVSTPGVSTPAVSMPAVSMPGVSTPGVSTPTGSAPTGPGRSTDVVVPAAALVELYRGGAQDQAVDACLGADGGIAVVATDRALARRIGKILADAGRGTDDHADASVVAVCAAAGGGVILTGDPRRITDLCGSSPAIVVRGIGAKWRPAVFGTQVFGISEFGTTDFGSPDYGSPEFGSGATDYGSGSPLSGSPLSG